MICDMIKLGQSDKAPSFLLSSRLFSTGREEPFAESMMSKAQSLCTGFAYLGGSLPPLCSTSLQRERPRRAGNALKAPLGPFYFTVLGGNDLENQN